MIVLARFGSYVAAGQGKNSPVSCHAQVATNAGTNPAASAHMGTMPKKSKTPAPIRPELIEPLTEILRDRGIDVRLWPADEAAAYRDNGRFLEGRDAVQKVRMAKAAAAIEEVFRIVVLQAYLDGISDAQATTGFTDETVQAILDKEGITVGPDGRAL